MRFLTLFLFLCAALFPQQSPLPRWNHNRPVLDAHNCYPYNGQWSDRLDRALSTGFPVAIEQDLAWANGNPVVSHSGKPTGAEPTLRAYFFEHVRPIVEKALRENDKASWPLIAVHFDFKDNRPELHHAVWALLGEYEAWLTTAVKTANPATLSPFDTKPLLVLTEDNDAQEQVFFTALPTGAKLRLFGSAHTANIPAKSREERIALAVSTPPEQLLTEKPTNYRRWWNNSWYIVEAGGQPKAGDWTAADSARLKSLVDHAHKAGFWIRFYTIDGFTPETNKGWDQGYNFGSLAAAQLRWRAAYQAGVNLIATDQFEDLATTLKGNHPQ